MENEELQKLITTLDSLGYRLMSINAESEIVNGCIKNSSKQTVLVISSVKNEKKEC